LEIHTLEELEEQDARFETRSSDYEDYSLLGCDDV
jgi:hypothetical protein